jgi:hypothetical protein
MSVWSAAITWEDLMIVDTRNSAWSKGVTATGPGTS